MKYSRIFLVVLVLYVVSLGCKKEDTESLYTKITGNWTEQYFVTDGKFTTAPGRQHIFRSNMKYRMICAVNEYCPTTPPEGEWSLLNDTTLQTVYNYKITLYIIDRADERNLWLRDRAKPKEQIRMIPFY